MHLFAEVSDKTSGRHGYRVGGIELWARADPPGALQNDNVTVVGMEVRPAEMIALGPFCIHGIKSRLVGVAGHDGGLSAPRVHGTPGNLLRQFVDHSRRIEFGR